MVCSIWRYDKPDIERRLGDYDLAYWLLRKDQTNHRAILTFLATRRVVHLEDELRASLDQLCLAGLGNEWSHPRRECAHDAVADIEFLVAILAARWTLSSHRRLARLTNINDDVVNN